MVYCFFGYLLDQALGCVCVCVWCVSPSTLSHNRVGRRRLRLAWTNLGVFGTGCVTREACACNSGRVTTSEARGRGLRVSRYTSPAQTAHSIALLEQSESLDD